MKNQKVADILLKIGKFHEIKGERFKARAYQQAVQTILSVTDDIEVLSDQNKLEELPGIGKSISKKIQEFLETGKIEFHEKQKKEFPVDVVSLLAIEGLGPKKIKLLYDELKITNVKELQEAIKKQKLRNLPGMGEKSELQLARSIEFLMKHEGRKLLGDVLPVAEAIKDKLGKLDDVDEVWLAGSLRRRRETIGDLDFLVISSNPEPIINSFTKLAEVEEILAKGSTKATVRINIGMDADLRVISPESSGAALLYFSGSKALNIELRKIAKNLKLKLNEYGLYKNGKMVAGKSEEDIFKILGLSYIEPEMRENRGEIQLAQENKLPQLITYSDIKGDLQIHTNWSDGVNTIEQMAKAAINLGHEYIAITDHTGTLRVAGGMNEDELLKQMKEIDKLNKELTEIEILKGAEVNIDSQGKLDIKNDILKDLDVVIASIHTGFRQDINKLTNRLISAMSNEYVDIIAHPTGRLIGEREGYELDIEKIFEKSIETNTFLEINSFPNRLDLNDVMIKSAIEHECQLVINTDSHNTKQLKYIEYGIATARRGWAQKKDILNTLSYKDLIKKIT